MRIRPGKSLVFAGIAMIFTGISCFFTGYALYLIPLIILVSFIAGTTDLVRIRKSIRDISVYRELPKLASRGDIFISGLMLDNGSDVTVSGRLRDVLPLEAEPDIVFADFTLSGGEKYTVRNKVRIGARGKYMFGPAWLRVYGPFSFFEGQLSTGSKGSIRIVPETLLSMEGFRKEISSDMILLEKYSNTRIRGEGTEFESISDYRQGDDIRRIDYRASARHRKLMVRRFQVEQHRDVILLLDCGRLMGGRVRDGTKLDGAVDSALMLSRIALENGDRCGIGIFDDKVLGFIPPKGGLTTYNQIVESIYDLGPSWNETDFSLMFSTLQVRQPKRSLIIVISDLNDHDTSLHFRSALASLGRRHCVIFAAIKTPLLSELVENPSSSMENIWEKAVVLRLMQEREKALHSLRMNGVIVLDADSRELSAPLVNKYLRVRARNIL